MFLGVDSPHVPLLQDPGSNCLHLTWNRLLDGHALLLWTAAQKSMLQQWYTTWHGWRFNEEESAALGCGFCLRLLSGWKADQPFKVLPLATWKRVFFTAKDDALGCDSDKRGSKKDVQIFPWLLWPSACIVLAWDHWCAASLFFIFLLSQHCSLPVWVSMSRLTRHWQSFPSCLSHRPLRLRLELRFFIKADYIIVTECWKGTVKPSGLAFCLETLYPLVWANWDMFYHFSYKPGLFFFFWFF